MRNKKIIRPFSMGSTCFCNLIHAYLDILMLSFLLFELAFLNSPCQEIAICGPFELRVEKHCTLAIRSVQQYNIINWVGFWLQASEPNGRPKNKAPQND